MEGNEEFIRSMRKPKEEYPEARESQQTSVEVDGRRWKPV